MQSFLTRAPAAVCLPAGLVAHLHSLASAAAPCEACGLLLGTEEVAQSHIGGGAAVEAHALRIQYFTPSNNVANQPERYFEIDPHLQISLQRRTRGQPLQVVGVWHSHPCGPAVPSRQDQKDAQIAPFLWLITGQENSGHQRSLGQINVTTGLATAAFWCNAQGLSRTALSVRTYRSDAHFLDF